MKIGFMQKLANGQALGENLGQYFNASTLA